MLRSRLLLRFAAPLVLFCFAGCHSGEDAKSPSSSAETTSADSRAFSEHDAKTALNAASRGLRSCREPSGPSALEARLKFEPSGNVSSVDVKPAAEPVATCVRDKLAAVSIMPFEGQPVTMSMRVDL